MTKSNEDPQCDNDMDNAVPAEDWETCATTEPTPEMPEADPTEVLRLENASLREKLLYLTADYQNYRKRVAKDLTEARMIGTTQTIDPFLKINDFLVMARQAADRSDNIDALRQGVIMILAEYEKAFDELGVVKLKTVGEKFDPLLHEAVCQEPSGTIPEGHIIREWAGGYKLGERLLRPARVVVSGAAQTEGEGK